MAPGISGVAAITCLALFAPEAHACGVSGPDGIMTCSLHEHEHEHEQQPRFRLGLSAIETATTIRFSGGLRGAERRSAVIGSLTYGLSERVTLQAGAGATLGGHLLMADGAHEFAPGATAELGAKTTLQQREGDAGYEATDLRAGVAFGTTLFDAVRPYALARVFGGPVFWRYQGARVTGTDVSHYQLGAGLAVEIARRLDLFVEGAPLGERAIAFGSALAL
jgi:hypothetical protein